MQLAAVGGGGDPMQRYLQATAFQLVMSKNFYTTLVIIVGIAIIHITYIILIIDDE